MEENNTLDACTIVVYFNLIYLFYKSELFKVITITSLAAVI